MKKRRLKLVVSLILAMTMIMGMSLNVMAATYSTDNSNYVGGLLVGKFRGVPKSGPMVELAVDDTICAGMEIYVSSDATVYLDDESVANGTILSKDAKVVSLDGAVMKLETESSTCEHTYGGAWEATPCGTMHWQKCTKCGEYGNNQDHTAPCSVCGYGASSSSSSSTPAAPTAEQMHEEYAKAVEATVAKEEALPVTSFASEAAVKAIPAEAKAGNDATFNISAITTTQGFVATINKVAKATTAPSMAVYSAKPITMNTTALNAVAKTGKTLVYTFSYKGHIYKVTIPAGAQVNTNGQMFMGPLAIGAQLGTTQVIK